MIDKLSGIFAKILIITLTVVYIIKFSLLLYRIIYNGSGGGTFEELVLFGYIALKIWAIYLITLLLYARYFKKTDYSISQYLRISGWVLFGITLIYLIIWII